jgi:hypothetical protein
MEQEAFLQEIAICREQSKNNGGKCKWGECDKCGVIPLLFKLGKGELLEGNDDISRIKKDVLK